MKIAIGCDPNAQEAKEEIIKYIEAKGYGEVTDFGSDDPSTPMLPSKSRGCGFQGVRQRDPDLWYRYRGVYRGQQSKRSLCGPRVRRVFRSEGKTQQRRNIACMGAFTTGNKVRELMVDAFLGNEFVPGCSSQPKVDAFVKYDQER